MRTLFLGMRFLQVYFVCLLLLISAASCKSKKDVVSNNTVKQNPNTSEKLTNSTVEKTETKNVEVLVKKPDEILKEVGTLNQQLKVFVAAWYATPYKYGGADKSGIDCSHFSAKLYADVYQKTIAGPANAIEQQTINVKTENAQEGDLVFFKINGDKVSHVGVYIGDNKFVHASTKRGVIISDLNEAYYKKYYYKTGRLK
ncbi:MAG TPA: C40 family peptidase [Bacteroidia bacterium]